MKKKFIVSKSLLAILLLSLPGKGMAQDNRGADISKVSFQVLQDIPLDSKGNGPYMSHEYSANMAVADMSSCQIAGGTKKLPAGIQLQIQSTEKIDVPRGNHGFGSYLLLRFVNSRISMACSRARGSISVVVLNTPSKQEIHDAIKEAGYLQMTEAKSEAAPLVDNALADPAL